MENKLVFFCKEKGCTSAMSIKRLKVFSDSQVPIKNPIPTGVK